MNFQQIRSLQKKYGVDKMQLLINSGQVWKMEGAQGRMAMELLRTGICMLPKEPKYNYYGNLVPSRDFLKPGTKGTFKNSVNFWSNVLDGNMMYIDALNQIF